MSLRSWEPNYNIDVLIDAFGRFAQARPDADARLHLLGGGPQADVLRAQVATLGLNEHVQFHGRVGDQAMVDAIQRSRVSLSVPTSDATSVSVLESMACGLPVVATDLPANRQWLDERGGCIVPVGDAGAITAALVHLHDHPALAAAMGEHNRARIEREASRRGQMDAMWRLYLKLLQAPRTGPHASAPARG